MTPIFKEASVKSMSAAESLEALRSAFKDNDYIYAQFAKACGLSEAEYWVLMMTRAGINTQTRICEELSMNKQTVHSAIKLLLKKELIYLEPQENNLRVKEIFFTPSGEAFALKHIDSLFHIEEQVWLKFTPEERAQLIALMQKFNRLLYGELQKHLDTSKLI